MSEIENAGFVTVWISTPKFKGQNANKPYYIHGFPDLGKITSQWVVSTESNWMRADHIVPSTYAGRKSGTASFRLLKWEHYNGANDPAPVGEQPVLQANQYICICIGKTKEDSAPYTAAAIKWFGTITIVEETPLKESAATNGFIQAAGPKRVLETTYLSGFVDSTKRYLQSPPGFNIPKGDTIIGNYCWDNTNSNPIDVGNFEVDPQRFNTTKQGENGAQVEWEPDETVPPATTPLYGYNEAPGAWTRYRTLKYLLRIISDNPDFGVYTNIPRLNLHENAKVGTAENDAVKVLKDVRPEAFFFDSNVTVAGALDLLINQGKGLDWEICIKSSGQWDIYIFTTTDVALASEVVGFSMPANPPLNIDLSTSGFNEIEVQYLSQDAQQIEKLIVEGENIVCCGTVLAAKVAGGSTSYDGKATILPKWGDSVEGQSSVFPKGIATASPEQIYAAGVQDSLGRVDQNATADQNEVWRGQAALADVFQLFQLYVDPTTGSYQRIDKIETSATNPTDFSLNGARPKLAFFPKFTWTVAAGKGSLTVDDALGSHTSPNAATATILPWIPWEVGYYLTDTGLWKDRYKLGGDATVQGMRSKPEYSEPKLYTFVTNTNYIGGRNIGLWFCRNSLNAYRPKFIPQDYMAIKIVHDNPHMIASSIWQQYFNAGLAGATNAFPLQSTAFPAVPDDFRYWALTLAGISDQKVSVTRYNPNFSAATAINKRLVRRVLRVFRSDLKCYYINKGTFVAGTQQVPTLMPCQSAEGMFTRNDFGTADRIATELAAYVFRPLSVFRLTLPNISKVPGVDTTCYDSTDVAAAGDYSCMIPGVMIGSVTDSTTRYVGTPVSQIEVSFEGQVSASLITFIPDLPNINGLTVSGSGGLAVVPGVGGSMAQVLREVKDQTEANTNRLDQVPIGETKGPGVSTVRTYMYTIIGGNTLPFLPGSVGVKKVNTAITSIPKGYLNGTPSTTIDGVGWAMSKDDGSFALVINDSTSLISHDILVNTPVYAVEEVKIDDTSVPPKPYTVLRITGTI
jgi:hypothetical protein